MFIVGPPMTIILIVLFIFALSFVWGVGEELTGCGCAGFIIVPLALVALFHLWMFVRSLGL